MLLPTLLLLLIHDLWLVPPAEAAVGRPVEVLVASGMVFPESENAPDPDRLTMQARGPDGRTAVVTVERHEQTIASFVPDRPGSWVISALTRPNAIEMTAEEFNSYLLHDGLPHVLDERMKAGETGLPAKERYSKSVTAVVDVGAGSGPCAPQSLKLEIVSLDLPRQGQILNVVVLFDGAPLPGALLCWDHPGNGEAFSGTTSTDESGRAAIPLTRGGLMTLRLVHMTRPRAPDHEYESFWTSLSLFVRA